MAVLNQLRTSRSRIPSVLLVAVAVLLVQCTVASVESTETAQISFTTQTGEQTWSTDEFSFPKSSSEVREGLDNLQHWFRSWPHVDAHFNKLHNTTFDVRDKHYVESIVMISVPFALAGVFYLLLGVFSLIGFCVCACCSLCSKKQDRYEKIGRDPTGTNFCRIFVRILVVLFALFLIGSSAFGIVASSFFHTSFHDTLDVAYRGSELLYHRASDVVQPLSRLPSEYSIDIPSDYQSLLENSKSYLDKAGELKRHQLKNAELARYIAMNASFGLVLFSSIVAIIAAFCGLRRIARGAAFLLLLGMFLMCIIVGASSSTAVLTSDLCPVADTYVKNVIFNGDDNLYYFMHCNNSDTDYDLYVDLVLAMNADYMQAQMNQENSKPGSKEYIEATYAMTNLSEAGHAFNVLLQCNKTANAYYTTKNEICVNVFLSVFVMGLTAFIMACFGVIVGIVFCCVKPLAHFEPRNQHHHYTMIHMPAEGEPILETAHPTYTTTGASGKIQASEQHV